MTDAHCHVTGGDPSVREFLIGREFVGIHPWEVGEGGTGNGEPGTGERVLASLRSRLESDPHLGVGEIGLDRLKDRDISLLMREIFEVQLKLAAELHRPVVLHGAKCWGQVVQAVHTHIPVPCSQFPIPALLFHGFSRSDGLIPDIVKLNGYISVGPAVLNDHATNYRELVKKIPLDRLLFETDRTPENVATCPPVAAVLAKTAELRGLPTDELEQLTDANATRFLVGA